eukprot:m.10400 g.10400  ORF g.10400 m.10400 type:complete len:1137 (+) comp3664_c0_seq1:89-3499(+)
MVAVLVFAYLLQKVVLWLRRDDVPVPVRDDDDDDEHGGGMHGENGRGKEGVNGKIVDGECVEEEDEEDEEEAAFRERGRGRTVSPKVTVSLITPKHPECDSKTYRVIRLANNLRAFLVHDPGLGKTDPDNDDFDERQGRDRKKVLAGEGDDYSRNSTPEDESSESEEEDSGDDSDSDDSDSDAEFDEVPVPAAVALCVTVGTFQDPPEAPGLAHFLEHMVFMGSKKCPDEDALEQFLQHNGGYSNAHTETEQTCFYFDVINDKLEPALDLFAQFFIDPLMKKTSLDRECEAVESEFQMAQQDDYSRFQHVLSSIAKPEAKVAKFSWGNKESLTEMPKKANMNIRKLLFEFKNAHYVGENMCCVIRSNHSLDEMQRMAEKILSDIPTHDGPCLNTMYPVTLDKQRRSAAKADGREYETPLQWEKDAFHKFITITPIKETHDIIFHWNMPSTMLHWRSKPLAYVSELAGHEGRGSIMHALQTRGLCTSLVAGNAGSGLESSSLHCTFMITVTLTEHGLSSVEEVMSIVFSYLRMLREKGPVKEFFDETKQIYDNNFRFQNDSEACDFVEAVACEMPFYDDEHILDGDEIILDFDKEMIQTVLDTLSFENVCIILGSNSVQDKCLETERWMGAQFGIHEIPDKWVELGEKIEKGKEPIPSFLHMPPPNKFITSEFDLKPKTDSFADPVLLVNEPDFELWHRHDDTYNTPRSAIGLTISAPACVASPRSVALAHIFMQCFILSLKEELYPATIADMSYSCVVDEMGISIVVKGFSSMLLSLADALYARLFSFNVEKDVFSIVKEKLQRLLANEAISPDRYARDIRLASLLRTIFMNEDVLSAMTDVNEEDVNEFLNDVKENNKALLFVHGNFSAEDALAVKRLVEKHRKKSLTRSLIPQPSLILKKGLSIFRTENKNPEDNVNTLEMYFQLPSHTTKDRVFKCLLENLVSEPMFQDLRTKQQLGYRVHFNRRNTFGRLGWVAQLSSPCDRVSTTEMMEKVDTFLRDFTKQLEKITAKDFESQLYALFEQLTLPDSNTSRNFNKLYYSIRTRVFDFNMKQEADLLFDITLDEVVSVYKKYLHPDSPERRVLLILIHSVAEKDVDLSNIVHRKHDIGSGKFKVLKSTVKPQVLDPNNTKLMI